MYIDQRNSVAMPTKIDYTDFTSAFDIFLLLLLSEREREIEIEIDR